MATSDVVLDRSHTLGQLSVWTHEQHLTFIFFCAVSLFSFQADSVFPARWAEPLTPDHPPPSQLWNNLVRGTDTQGDEGEASR